MKSWIPDPTRWNPFSIEAAKYEALILNYLMEHEVIKRIIMNGVLRGGMFDWDGKWESVQDTLRGLLSSNHYNIFRWATNSDVFGWIAAMLDDAIENRKLATEFHSALENTKQKIKEIKLDRGEGVITPGSARRNTGIDRARAMLHEGPRSAPTRGKGKGGDAKHNRFLEGQVARADNAAHFGGISGKMNKSYCDICKETAAEWGGRRGYYCGMCKKFLKGGNIKTKKARKSKKARKKKARKKKSRKISKTKKYRK